VLWRQAACAPPSLYPVRPLIRAGGSSLPCNLPIAMPTQRPIVPGWRGPRKKKGPWSSASPSQNSDCGGYLVPTFEGRSVQRRGAVVRLAASGAGIGERRFRHHTLDTAISRARALCQHLVRPLRVFGIGNQRERGATEKSHRPPWPCNTTDPRYGSGLAHNFVPSHLGSA